MPDGIVVGWDTLTVPTYRHEAFEPYQSGRVFEQSILEQLDLLPDVVRAAGFAVGKADGYEADDFLAAAARTWPGEVRRVTCARDTFHRDTDRVRMLQPPRASPISCDGLPRSRAPRRRAGQVTDLTARCAATHPTSCRRAGIGPKKRLTCASSERSRRR